MVGIIRIQLHVEEDKYILLVWEKLIDLGFKVRRFGESALSDLIMEKGFLDSGGRGRNQRKKDTTLRSSNDPAATNAADKKHDSKDDEVNTSVTEPFSSVSDTYGSPNSLAQKLHDIPNPGQDTSGPSVVQTCILTREI
ncbi:hypothetical protein Tco_0961279 [Tanacetum coccineum]